MQKRIRFALTWLILLTFAVPLSAQAAVVGRFTMVAGQVDLLKQGRLPAVGAKVQDGVEPGDVVRTKSKAKAQIKFVDDSTLTLAPESRLAVADYTYDPAARQRRAVVRLFRGLVHAVVSRILDIQEPEFIVETMTAVIGVRGTEFYTLLTPNCAYAYLIKGRLSTASANRRITQVVFLEDRRKNRICLDQPPGPALILTGSDEDMLKRLMITGVLGGLEPPMEGPPPPVFFDLPLSPEGGMQPTIPPMLQQMPRKD